MKNHLNINGTILNLDLVDKILIVKKTCGTSEMFELRFYLSSGITFSTDTMPLELTSSLLANALDVDYPTACSYVYSARSSTVSTPVTAQMPTTPASPVEKEVKKEEEKEKEDK